MKKRSFMFLIATVLLFATVGCQSSKSGSNASPAAGKTFEPLSFPLKDPVTMKVFSWYQGDFNPENPLVKEFERLTNIKLDYNAPADGYAEKQSLILASPSGDWPDVMLLGASGGREVNEISQMYGQAGKFVKISDYLDKLPNLKAYYDQYPEARTLFEDGKGDTYIFPYLYPYKTVPTGFFYNAKAFEAVGLDAPKTVDDIYDAAKKLKEKFPTSYPVTSYTIPETLTVWSRVFSTSSTLAFDQEQGKYIFGPFTPEYRQMLEFLHKLFAEKLYDPQFPQYTFAGDDWRQTLATEKSFITESYVWEMQYENTAKSVNVIAKNMNLQDKVQFKYIPPLSANGKPSKYRGLTTVSPSYGMVINANSPYVNEALALLDWQLGEDFFRLLGYGIEGVTYEMKDGQPVFMDNITTTDEPGKTPLNDSMSFYAGLNIYEIYPDPYGWKTNLEKFTGYTMEEMGEFAAWPDSWMVRFDQEKKDEHALALTPSTTLVDEMSYKFITGKASFDDYDKFIETLKGYGIEKVVDDYNKFYQENVKK
ncbi:extracellular solute-binding protein [Cohnella herbarum]|uniref:Extracellular solute-binding protein n=1 Tax=Cohnella herbarum TaxID=2728023 RepID=A0A7Z2VI24_9BACL|nr:extracellular solute-binding protein [Cohnella herbarum]QJD83264.1 extracellular solute-binding protein [Cohnella herbarum]QJD88495.1 extracellular solute-binding protein [Cohnella herbarum]